MPDFGTIHIHNIKTDGKPPATSKHFYIGRGNGRYGLTRSPLANPFTVEKYGRELALERYRQWLYAQESGRASYLIHLMTGIVRGGADIHLYCWCFPESCHGDVVKALIEERLAVKRGAL